MKIIINTEEVFPIYSLEEVDVEDLEDPSICGEIVDINEKTFKKWNKIIEEYNLIQDHIGFLLKNRMHASKIDQVSNLAIRYGMTDGSHHKQWVIDQMLQTILGKKRYKEWLEEYNNDPAYLPWDKGIP